ncbi:MAG: iron-containing alcohol dehydrogenase [Actinomycetota bacterium]
MEDNIKKAEKLLKDYKGKNYTFGIDCLDSLGNYVKQFGSNTLLIISESQWAKPLKKRVLDILIQNGIERLDEVDTSKPNTPVEDVLSLSKVVNENEPDSILCVGGGSAIDCAKIANILASLDTDAVEPYLGEGEVSKALKKSGKQLYPLVAVQCNAASGSHLSKNAVITFPQSQQKKLISDQVLIPDRSVFDYSTTLSQGRELTIDGALDGFSHSLEVYYGLKDNGLAEDVCLTSINLIVNYLPKLVKNLKSFEYRKAIGLATDLGGYALMLGGTSGPHLNSFSMVDVSTHGRACAILNPYYTVFYAPKIMQKLEKISAIFSDYMEGKIDIDDSRKTGEAVAGAILNFFKSLDFPTKLDDIEGFSEKHINRAINAAKNPQLEMKLKNMSVPLNIENVEKYMKPILLAAKKGDFSLIENLF